MPRFEYLLVVLAQTTNYTEIQQQPADERPDQTWEFKAYVWAPGAVTGDEHVLVDEAGKRLPDLLNTLGRQGWEMMTETVLSTTIVSFEQGWGESAIPIRWRYIFKREAV